jgi:hypothetical protein
MNQLQLEHDIQLKVKDASLNHLVVEKLNEVSLSVAGRENPRILLPDLETSGTVTTSTTAGYVSLPSDFHRNLYNVYSADSDSDDIDIYQNKRILHEEYGASWDDEGSVVSVAVSGSYLYYVYIPSSADTLTLRYYSKPTTFSKGSNVDITFVPEHLIRPVLGSKTAAEILLYLSNDWKLPDQRRNDYLQRAGRLIAEHEAGIMQLYEYSKSRGVSYVRFTRRRTKRFY